MRRRVAPARTLESQRPHATPLILRLPGGLSLRLHRRSLLVSLGLAAAMVVTAVLAIGTGAYPIAPDRLVLALTGRGETTDVFIVLGQRVPRTLAALATGAALGLSGCVFQSLSRNPLGSPDIIGFTTGAASGGLVVILVAGTSSAVSIAAGTVVGGLATALVVYLLGGRGGTAGERLVLVGISIGAMLAAVNDYLLTRADLASAEAARAWQFGSLNAISWAQTWPLLGAVVVLVPLTLAAAYGIRALELGDDSATALGVSTARTRLVLLVLGVALAATAVAAAGPIGFLALAAPQLARRLARSPGAAVLPSMLMGAVLLGVSDLLAQRLLSPFQIPVGLVTAALGGLYLMWLLRHRAG